MATAVFVTRFWQILSLGSPVWLRVNAPGLALLAICKLIGIPFRMPTLTPHSLPQLAPPGAGIPAIERIIAGLLLSLRRRFATPASINPQFKREQRAIAALCAGRDEHALSTRVLIPRLLGLEDSSRFWSVWMTLDHLRIVNEAIANAVSELTLNRSPESAASTAAVKPTENVGSEVVAGYQSSCAKLATIFLSGVDLRAKLRYPHPWFGPLDALGWCVMSAMHMRIHRAQIGRILRDVPKGST